MYARGGSTPPARTMEKTRTVEIPTVRVFSYALEVKNVLIYRVLHSFLSTNDDETAAATSDMSASRSSLKRSAYRSNVMATDGWPSIRCMAFTFVGFRDFLFIIGMVPWSVGRKAMGRNGRETLVSARLTVRRLWNTRSHRNARDKSRRMPQVAGHVSAARRILQSPRVASIVSIAPAASSGSPDPHTGTFASLREYSDTSTIPIPTQAGEFASVWEHSGRSVIPIPTHMGAFASLREYSDMPAIPIPARAGGFASLRE